MDTSDLHFQVSLPTTLLSTTSAPPTEVSPPLTGSVLSPGGVASQVSHSPSVPITDSLLSPHTASPSPQIPLTSSQLSPPPSSISHSILSTDSKKLLSPRVSGEGSHSSDSATPIPSEASPERGEEREGDRTLTEDEESEGEEEEIEEKLEHGDDDVDEISFREVLPSESHRLRRKKQLHLHLPSAEVLDAISVSYPYENDRNVAKCCLLIVHWPESSKLKCN